MVNYNVLENYFTSNYPNMSLDDMFDVFQKHEEYKTHIIFRDKNTVWGYVRWNVEGDTALILDCVIDKNYRDSKIFLIGMSELIYRFPGVRYLRFFRPLKNDKREHKIDIYKYLLKRS